MHRLFSMFFVVAAGVICVITALSVLLGSARVGYETIVGGVSLAAVLTIASRWCYLRHARRQGMEPIPFLPDRRFLMDLSAAILVVVCFAAFVAASIYAAFCLPREDSWIAAVFRLLFVVLTLLSGVFFQRSFIGGFQRLFRGRASDDLIDSLGEPITWPKLRKQLRRDFTMGWLILFAAICALILGCVLGYADLFLEIETHHRKMRRLQALVRMLAQHPKTVVLFTGTALSILMVTIVCRCFEWFARKTSEGQPSHG